MSKYNLDNINSIGSTKILFDANILIYLFWSTNLTWEKKYSVLYQRLIIQNNKFVLNFVIISEFINRILKIEYANYLKEHNITEKEHSYKSFRDSEIGQELQSDIYIVVQNKLLKKFEIIDKEMTKSEIENILIVDILDFSDKFISKLCEEHKLILLTNDGDFKNSGVDILSLNKKL